MANSRPNPDELLAHVNEQARRDAAGRLKIFFGAAPGVGKTFAMLKAARAQQAAGVDVLAGIVETHGRPETAALLDGLPQLPRRQTTHRGIAIEEFDLDAALARKPQLLLLDELAHTNAPNSRHLKRWQDALECIDAGIAVYATLNVQHLDSLNDVVAQITGIAVRETVPDSVLDRATEIELIDISVDELRRRIEDGKVYIHGQAQRAMDGFFRPGNLIALRELALRATADRVDSQMRSYRQTHAIRSTWPATERLMVSIGPSPFSSNLIRATKRMADQLGAEWIAVYVEKSSPTGTAIAAQDRIAAALRLAEQLGAETATIPGDDIAASLLHYARSRNVSKIVTGKHAGPLWKRLWQGSVLDSLIAHSGDIPIIAISGDTAAPANNPAQPSAPANWRPHAEAAGIIGLSTALSLALRTTLAPANLVMFYLLGVVAVAMRSNRNAALFASVLSVAAFDFFCVPPYYTFAVADYEYGITFAVMLTVAVVISTLAVRIRQQAANAAERETRTQALYRLSRELSGETRWFDAAQTATTITSEVFQSRIVLFFPVEPGHISFQRRTTEDLPIPRSEEGIAQWVFDHGQKAGKGMPTLPGATALYLPLKGSQSVLGVMAVLPSPNTRLDSPGKQHLLEIFASQTALAIERAQSAAATSEAQWQAETERMRSGLLSAVSHDLRTPLATITGAASSLIARGEEMPRETREELLESIEQEADRLGRLVNNLLEMTRLESGAVEVHREWHPLEELIGAALTRLDRALCGRPVATSLATDLPMIPVDGVLLEQVFINLLENAIKYTPPGTPISIRAREENRGVTIEFADSGPGFQPGEEERIWQKFYRGNSGAAAGAGLGLAICQAIVKAHGGTIQAKNNPEGGALLQLWLPLTGPPPKAPPE